MSSATTSDFVGTGRRLDAPPFSMIEQKGLIRRLAEELVRAFREFSGNPRGFIHDLFVDGEKDQKRSRLLRISLLCALAAHLALIAIVVVLGWNHLAARAETEREYEVTMVPPTTPTNPHGEGGAGRGDEARDKRGSGGGGGGMSNPLPASAGALPKISPAQQVVHPLAPASQRPVLPVPATIVGPQNDSPPPDVALGVPTGAVDAPPSPGTGTGGGMGGGSGTGVGSGNGPGGGPGKGGGTGGGNRTPGTPDGTGSGTPGRIAFNDPQKPAGFAPFSWTYRPTPIVTPEAQANKVAGTVLLRATFNSDGTITDIEIVNPVPYMTDSAKEALRRSRFRPATVNGTPVTLVRVPVRINVHY